MPEKGTALVQLMTGAPMKVPAAVSKFTVSMSADTDPESAMQYIGAVGTAVAKREDDLGRLRTVLGQLVYQAKQLQVYKPKFSTFGEFIAAIEQEYSLEHTSVMNCVSFVRTFPSITPTDAAKMPVRNMTTAVRAARKAESPQQRTAIINAAIKLPAAEFERSMKAKGLLATLGRPEGGSRSAGTVTLSIPTGARTATRYRENARQRNMSMGEYLEHLLSLEPKVKAA